MNEYTVTYNYLIFLPPPILSNIQIKTFVFFLDKKQKKKQIREETAKSMRKEDTPSNTSNLYSVPSKSTKKVEQNVEIINEKTSQLENSYMR